MDIAPSYPREVHFQASEQEWVETPFGNNVEIARRRQDDHHALALAPIPQLGPRIDALGKRRSD